MKALLALALALALGLAACARAADDVTAIHVSQWQQFKDKCNHSSSEYDPSFFPVGNLDDCNKYFDCRGSFLPMFHCPDGQDFNAKLKKCDTPANAGCSN
ncbi:uncharacterized protein LOC134540037 isoform X2 [Bacillus rossius redtenbacheri]|uniref:uncharacterized protein LOC134540037 isoform X2 n=1 Tax=Bacillus rossius redtenbacheri TaxID=93214 RepID=UPI002FDE27AD